MASAEHLLAAARARLAADPLHMLFDEVAGPVGGPVLEDAAGVFCWGLRVVSMDGTTSNVPNTDENADHFGRPGNATRAGAFSQVRWVAAAESGTGALLGAGFGLCTVGEQILARDLLAAFGPGMVVLADRNFLSHTLARDVLATGAHILWRASASFTLRPIEVLADGGYLAQLYPVRRADGPPITLRVTEYTVHTTGPDGAEEPSEMFALVTDLLNIGGGAARNAPRSENGAATGGREPAQQEPAPAGARQDRAEHDPSAIRSRERLDRRRRPDDGDSDRGGGRGVALS